MATIRLTGTSARNWFAEQMVKDYGPEEALERTAGPMHEAVKQVIASLQSDTAQGGGDV